MMSSLIVSILTIFSIISFHSFSIPNVIATTSSSSLLQETCNKASHVDFCLQLLQSYQKITSSTNLFDLSIAIMESGISNATNTHAYIKSKLKETNLTPDFMGALRVCDSSYSRAIDSMSSALGEVSKTKEYQTSNYDLSMSCNDAMEPCLKALAFKEIKDDIILSGNKAVEMFASSFDDVVDVLYGQNLNENS